MEHVEDGAESIGAMLSDIAESLREVSRKLDLVAARVDLPLPVPIPGDDRDVATRLATIEAWAFRTDRDVADLGRRLDTLQSVADAPGTGRRHAPEPGSRREAGAEPGSSGGRRAAEDGAGFQGVPDSARSGRRAAGETGAVPARLGRRAADDGSRSGETQASHADQPSAEGRSSAPPRRRAAEREAIENERGSADDSSVGHGLSRDGAAIGRRAADDSAGPASHHAENGRAPTAGRRTTDEDAGLAGHRAENGQAPTAGRRATDEDAELAGHRVENGQAPAVGRRAAEVNGRAELSADSTGAGRRAAEGTDSLGADRRAAEVNGSGPGTEAEAPRRRAVEHDGGEPARGVDDAGTGRRAAGELDGPAVERPASAYGPAGRGTQPSAGPEVPGETAAPRIPRPRYAAGSARQRIAEARAESAGRLAADQGATPAHLAGDSAHLAGDSGAQPGPAHGSAVPGAQPTPADASAQRTSAQGAHSATADPDGQSAPAHLSADSSAQSAPLSADAGTQPAGHLPAAPGVRPAPPRRPADPAETAVSPRLSADPGAIPAPRRPAETSERGVPARLSAPEPEPAADDEPAGPQLRAAVEARRASGRLPQRGVAPSPAPPGGTASQAPAPEHTELTSPGEADRWSGPRRNGTSLGLGETVAAAYDQGLRDGFTGQQDGYRQAPAAGYPLAESGEDFAPFADRQPPDAQTEQVGRGLTSGPLERPYGDFGPGLTGATAEETAHADKVQAMLDELKRTAAAMPFGPPTGENQDRR